jgi:hypothetical protein
MRRSLATIAVAVAALAGTVPAAQASTRSKIIADCSDDGVLQGHYTPSQLRDARKHLPSDVAEYTDCPDVLRRAELGTGSSGGSGGGGGSSVPINIGGASVPPTGGAAPAVPPAPAGVGGPVSPQDHAALAAAQQAPDGPVRVGGQNLLAGAAPLREGYRANGLPASLVVALILLALAGIALAIPPVRRRLPLHRFTIPRFR